MTPSVLRRRLPAAVNRGAAYLDENDPGWYRRVKLTKLDMRSTCDCVLGQLDGGIYVAVAKRGLTWEQAGRLGFDGPAGCGLDVVDELYDRLDVLWRDAIRQRRAR